MTLGVSLFPNRHARLELGDQDSRTGFHYSPRRLFVPRGSKLWTRSASYTDRNRHLNTAFCYPAATLRCRIAAAGSNAPGLHLRLPCRTRFQPVRLQTPSPASFGHRGDHCLKSVVAPSLCNCGHTSNLRSPSGFLPLPDRSARSDSCHKVFPGRMPDHLSLPGRLIVKYCVRINVQGPLHPA